MTDALPGFAPLERNDPVPKLELAWRVPLLVYSACIPLCAWVRVAGFA